ncbi:hypothetical protein ABZP36_008753 [Zizania latifolia]
MEESQGGQEYFQFGDFVGKTPRSASRSAADTELHNMAGSSEARTAPLNTRMPAAMHETSRFGSNLGAVGLSRSDGLPDEQSLASAFDRALSFRNLTDGCPTNPCNAVPANGHYPSGPMNAASLQSCDPQLAQGGSMQTDGLTVGYQEQAPLHFGSLPRNFGMNNMGGVASTSYKPFYIDRQSQMYAPYQQAASNFILQHDMDSQNYSVVPPHYVYPQMQRAAGSDVRSNPLAAVCAHARSRSSYLGTSNAHQLGLDGAAFQNGNSQWDNSFMDSFPGTQYTDSSHDYRDLHYLRQAEKFAHPYKLNSSLRGLLQHQIPDDLSSMCYPEKMLMKPDGENSVRTFKLSPINGWSGMDRRINGYGHNHLDVQRNEVLRLNRLNSQFLSLKSEYDLAMKTTEVNYSSVDEVAGRICMLAKDQNGCRFLQKVVTEGTQEDVEKVLAETTDHIAELMVDQFGNYLIQKLLEEGSDDQRMRIISEITRIPGELVTVACNMHGTRAVQKVIETINAPDQVSKVVSALSPGAMRLLTDTNGNHLVQRCLQQPLPEYKTFLLDAAKLRFLRLAKDQQGCCTIQKCIEHANDDQKYHLLYNITSNALSLSQDQFGNYVIQFIISLGVEWAMAKIVNELQGHFGYLSMQKCSSHVVENCLRRAPQLVQERIIEELMNDPKLLHIMLDQYGNYVIQTALKVCKGELHTAFVEAIKPHAPALQNNMYGKKVISRTYLKNKQYRFGIL